VLVYCVTVAFTMTERADQLHYDNITQVCQPPLQPRFGSLPLLASPKATIAVEMEEISECYGHTVHKLNQRRLTAH
jgi:hypothetical protein